MKPPASTHATRPEVTTFFDEATFTASHVVADPVTSRCAIIDSVLDFDPASGRTSTHNADRIRAFIAKESLTVEWHFETHIHADHLSAAPYLRAALGGRIAIGRRIVAVQETFGALFNEGPGFRRDGSQFDQMFGDAERFQIGAIEGRVMHTPGHTPACVTLVIGDAAFVGDTLFMPDYGSARCDFPGGDAAMLYRSVQKIFALPDETRLFLCHDYKAPGRDVFAFETTVAAQKAGNIHLHEGVSEDAFVTMRTARDDTLAMPRLMLPSVQVNMRAGNLPAPEANGVAYLKTPINAL